MLLIFYKIYFYGDLKRNELYFNIKISRCLNIIGKN